MTEPPQIGRYLIERRVGRGGMALIYLAHDPVMRRPVAIKLLPQTMLQDSTFALRFQREVETLATLEHPAIVPVYDYGEHEHQPYYVMRFMPGGSLVDKLKKGTLSVPETAKIIRQIAPALDAAHRKSIIHRDIKPGNILFDSEDNAFLSDFGIVKIASAESELSRSSVMGTPTYMSPELARGDVDIDGRSDIYALGVLIFRMWAGVAPYSANTPMGIAMKHVIDPIPNILNFKPSMPASCNLLIQKAMSKSREDRFQQAVDLSAALDEISETGYWYVDEIYPTLPEVDNLDSQGLPRTEEPISKSFYANTNLPRQSSSFIGRQSELLRIEDRLENPDCRLLTLLGPGGIGKTRLALEAAERAIPNFSHGVYLVSLTSVQSGDLILPAIAESVGFNFYESDHQKFQLLNYLRTKSLLLILDNFEHLIDEAILVSEILQNAHDVKIIVTTRERLNLTEEWIIQVHGMDVPDAPIPPDFASYPAVQLFLDRAHRVSPRFKLTEADKPYVVRICQLIEGIPLGIELAAAWIRLLTLAEIASEIEQNLDFLTSSLRNTALRHRSLRAVFNYSWELLSQSEQEVFRRLSIFRSGFTRSAAAHITGANLQSLRGLVDKSLLENNERDRYEMQDVIRQYANEQLVQDEKLYWRMRQAHSDYYTTLLQSLEGELMGGSQKVALMNIQLEFENIRDAWDWALQNAQIEKLAATYNALYRFLEFRGRLIEGSHIFSTLSESLAKLPQDDQSVVFLRFNAEARCAAFLYRLGRPGVAEPMLLKSIEFLRTQDAVKELSFALTYLGAVAYLQKNYRDAQQHLEESIMILDEQPDQLGNVIALHHLALVAREMENYEKSQELFFKSLEVNREMDNPFGEAISLNNLGHVAFLMGNLEEAWTLHNRSLDIREEMEDRWGIANSLDGLGQVALKRGDLAGALYLFDECSEIYREVGDEHRLNAALAHKAMIEAQL